MSTALRWLVAASPCCANVAAAAAWASPTFSVATCTQICPVVVDSACRIAATMRSWSGPAGFFETPAPLPAPRRTATTRRPAPAREAATREAGTPRRAHRRPAPGRPAVAVDAAEEVTAAVVVGAVAAPVPALPAVPGAAGKGNQEDEERPEERNDAQDNRRARVVGGRGRICRRSGPGKDGSCEGPPRCVGDGGERHRNPADVVTSPEAGRYVLGQDGAGAGIGERCAKARAHGDPVEVRAHEHQEQHPVVAILLADPPGVEYVLGEGLDALARRQVAVDPHDDLRPRLLVETLQGGVHRRGAAGIQHAGMVGDVAGRGRWGGQTGG